MKRKYGIDVFFHVKESLNGVFGHQVTYLPVSKSQRWHHRQDVLFNIWHNLHQLNRTCPPSKTNHRLATVHDLNFLYFKTGYSRWRDTWRMRRTLSRMTHLVSISEYVRKDFLEKMGWRKPIEVIYNGARDLTEQAREPIDNWNGRPFIFHLSRMARSKNIHSIIELARIWPEMDFIFAGPSSEDSKNVIETVASLDLKNILILTNINDQQKSWLFSECYAFLFPSWTEGFGLPPIEAMHFGKPVFLSNLTSLPEIGGACAIYFDDFSPQSMKATIIKGVPILETLKGKIENRAQSFDWDKCASSYIDLYLRLLNKNKNQSENQFESPAKQAN